ncbi:MAG: XrtA/PEP-CTERM system-associated ATPase [Alphaproteobacteria bacterium]
MFTAFYNLTGRPFQLSPDPRFFFGSRSHKKAMAYLTYGLNQGEGFIIVTGDIGAGKTTLVGHLLSQLDSQKYIAAQVVTTQIDADDTLRMVASAFDISQESRDKATLLREIEGFLVASHGAGKRVLLIIDEVQNLPPASLEELRMLSNFQVRENPVLQCYLLGQPQFRRTLASHALEQLRQRVIASYHLEPLDAEETRAYIEHRLRMVGWKNDPGFADGAFDAIHAYTRGVPRRINTLCSRLLLFGFLEEKHEVDKGVVEEVIHDLDQEGAHGDIDKTIATAAPMILSEETPAETKAVNGEFEQLFSRVEVLERYVKAHERTIKRALEIAAEYLDGTAEEESDTDAGRR